jgi:hypothetical protein
MLHTSTRIPFPLAPVQLRSSQFPEAGHDFPDAQRQAANEFLDQQLRGKSSAQRRGAVDSSPTED